MAEQLQELLERIQKDGVDQAQAEAERILAGARAEAERLVKAAHAEAEQLRRQAEADGKAFAERGETALKQAARDVLLALGACINRALRGLVGADVKAALADPETLGRLVEQAVTAYAQAPEGRQRLEVLLPQDQLEAVRRYGQARLAEALRAGLSFTGDGHIIAGFRVAVAGDRIEHDFTENAITSALCELLRPQVAAIVREAALRP